MWGQGDLTKTLALDEVRQLLAQSLDALALDGKRVLVIIPDHTRTAPLPLLFQVLYDQIGRRVARLDYLIALGTHPPMRDAAIDAMLGVTAETRAAAFPNVRVFNHQWADPRALETLGVISGDELRALTNGLLSEATPVRLNRMIQAYDQVVICGPVFPHEVVGFSGGAKYLFPGIAGAEIIHATHWLGALTTSMATIGIADTPVRRVIHRAAEFVTTPLLCIALVLRGSALHGMYIGSYLDAWSRAAALSAQLNIITVPRAFPRVLSMPAPMYDELWTAAKAMYKTEPAIADGGEVIIYAPHLREVSRTHGALIDAVGYHVRDYFVKQPERFRDVPGSIKAHSTHVKGAGTYDAARDLETPRIRVTLATGIAEEHCRRLNLGFMDYREIDVNEWRSRENEGILVVPHAGEMLYRARDLPRPD
jgi:nickel-dependent lactate racemase